MPRHPIPEAPSAQDMKFQAEDDVRTLVRAEDIRKDAKRLERAMKEARSQMAALKKVKAT